MSGPKFFSATLGLAALAALLAGCAPPPTPDATVSPGVSGVFAKRFAELRPAATIVAAQERDLDGDGRADLALVFEDGQGRYRTTALLDLEGGAALTNEFKAPLERQAIDMKDIDSKPPVEFIVRGAKGGALGYAIYRVKGRALEDVFGSNMANCCGN